ncbi:Mce family protein [Gordonia polyisoprenivorans NBRC 16320 = JCM 10675]|uniref:MCE family protein n=1 Tax=Gordonia polyisoprenivorans TaxID=84595 RepID=A0A846WXP6_9ACTN|nr:MlaD family protein [Gordonia polyisoprenivorans]NKY05211.1 MCE family protein [Gordonia polyisoprenivorans]GAB24052.1 Mce family protein [Gordonia polyisoprenivorans NBRC 16320 = JCM 10675]
MITKTRVSAIAMLTLVIVSIYYMTTVGLQIADVTDTRTAKMVVADSNGLMVGSRVLLRGVQIGEVTSIDPIADGVEVTWKYGKSYRIPEGSAVRLDDLSALGESYVAVLPTTQDGPYLANGATVPRQNVAQPTTFRELSSRVTDFLKQVNPDEVQRIFTELDVGFPDGADVINDLNRAGTLLAEQITQQRDNLITLLSTLQPLLMRSGNIPADLAQSAPLMKQFGPSFALLLHGIGDAKPIIGNSVGVSLHDAIMNGASPFLAIVQKLLDESSGDLHVIGVNLLPAAQAGAAAMSTVRLSPVLGTLLGATTPNGALTIRVGGGG